MRFVIMGAGGLGGYFGARLASAGNDVAFVARGAHLAAIRQKGLRVSSALGDLHLREVAATDDPSTLAPADVVIIAVKLWDLETAAAAVKPLVRPGTAVVSFQNGVSKDDVLIRTLGREAVIGGIAQIGVVIASPAVIAHTGTMAKLIFGELDNSRSRRVEALLAACTQAGIDAEIAPDTRLATWEKFAFLVGMSAVTTTMRSRIGPIRANPQTRAFLRDVIEEAVLVGRAMGVPLAEDYTARRMAMIDGLPAEMTASMQGDLVRGNRLEVPWLSGAVVELGKQAGVPTPLNRAVYDILALYVDGAPVGGRAA
ncbi:MAG: ketopantoate reductase family protein [Acetobacteraceae bacterium]|nr:ketopantoate reductase family protein [Acetobacteraceae bacterium]